MRRSSLRIEIVGLEVEKVLVDANWLMLGGMRRSALRIGMQLPVGLSLGLTRVFALRETRLTNARDWQSPQWPRYALDDARTADPRVGILNRQGTI